MCSSYTSSLEGFIFVLSPQRGESWREGLVIRRPEGQRAGKQAGIGASQESNLFAGSARRKQPDL